ncbi:MAG TPA: hypothetical protein VLA43_18830 [Longimicrobiales bacterium]|nr:hypothetical protein [Longimicrobiales bacterium]
MSRTDDNLGRRALEGVVRWLAILARELAPTVMHRKYLAPRGRRTVP